MGSEGRRSSGPAVKTYVKNSYEEVLKMLQVDPEFGLSDAEVKERVRRYGSNDIPEKKESIIRTFGKKFWGLTAWMLELTIVVSYLLHRYVDVYVIAALLVLNSIIGLVQEQRASKAVEMLKSRLEVTARVKRNGRWTSVRAHDVVPGDIVRVRAGDYVPADVKLIVDQNLSVDESALTGESMDSEKGLNAVIYSGSVVRRGEATGVVVATGVSTLYGRTTQLVQTARPKLHMEEVTSRVVEWLLAMVGTMAVAVLFVSYIRGEYILQVVPLILVLIVFAVPVALPAMFTVSMAYGSLELSKKGVLVTRLSASEDAASMDVLCADKTGTITMNRVSVAQVVAYNGFREEDVIIFGATASQEANKDPIDEAFVSAARERGLPIKTYRQEEFVPFDPSTRKTEAVVVSQTGDRFRVVKGSVETVLQSCEGMDRTLVQGDMDSLAAKGYRAIAVAILGTNDSGYRLCGLVGLYDMPRPDSKSLISKLKELGISVKMLTGDALPVAREVGKEVGLGDSILRASDLRTRFQGDEKAAARLAASSSGFAEIYPEDKYMIVKSLQTAGHITGMTGDGINDAAALKQAEVGIAVSTATDVAKGAASVVLTEEGLSGIVDLVRIGRMIYQRIVTWTINKIVKTFQVAVFIAVAFLITGVYVVSALDVVLLLFSIDFVTISIATDTVRWSGQPDRWKVSSLAKVGIWLGVLSVLEMFGMLFIALKVFGLTGDIGRLNTLMFAALFYQGIFTVLIVRERGNFWRSRPSKILLLSMGLDMIAVGALVLFGFPGFPPIEVEQLLLTVVFMLLFTLMINNFFKVTLMKKYGLTK